MRHGSFPLGDVSHSRAFTPRGFFAPIPQSVHAAQESTRPGLKQATPPNVYIPFNLNAHIPPHSSENTIESHRRAPWAGAVKDLVDHANTFGITAVEDHP